MDNTNLSDNIFAAIQSGDEGVFAILFRKYYKKLCGICFSYVKRYDIAEELASDVLLTLWRKRDAINISTSLTFYLFKTAKNISLNYLEKEKKSRIISLFKNDKEQEQVEGDVIRFSDNISYQQSDYMETDEWSFQEKINRIYKGLLLLAPLRKEIMELHFVKGLKPKEIAEKLGIPEKNVRNNIERGAKQLRNMVHFERGGPHTLLFLIALQDALYLLS